jgi:uncharacterized protein (DUF305 family)
MFMSKLARVCATAVVAAALLSACGGSKKQAEPSKESQLNVVQPGAPGKPSRKVGADQLAAAGSVEPIAEDVEFMRGMIHHHAQAILMTGWAPSRTQSTDVRLMARRMAISQQSEIELSQTWLQQRGFDAMEHMQHDGSDTDVERMPGMLTDAQLERLKAASGRRFDRLFLRYMTQHHRGALTMVQQLQAAGGGAETEIGSFARHVEADQQIEIERMQQVLARLR